MTRPARCSCTYTLTPSLGSMLVTGDPYLYHLYTRDPDCREPEEAHDAR